MTDFFAWIGRIVAPLAPYYPFLMLCLLAFLLPIIVASIRR